MQRLRYSKEHRLLALGYTALFKKGYRRRDKAFDVLYQKNQKEYPRIGIIIGKKQIKRSVLRHRFKRIIRESFRLNQYLIKGYDYVFILKKEALVDDVKALRQAVDKTWLKITSTAAPVKESVSPSCKVTALP